MSQSPQIRSMDQLAAALRGGQKLVKTHSPNGPSFDVEGRHCDLAIAVTAIEAGTLQPTDPGLFGPTTEQAWELRTPAAEPACASQRRMTHLIVDGEQIRTFADAVFRYASDGQTISLRIFPDEGKDDEEALGINPVRVNGRGLEPVIEAAIAQAQRAANHRRRAVFCPPLAGFKPGRGAKETDLTEGYTLSVDCDQRPNEARQRLEQVLGLPTLVTASGGVWTDPATGELQDKVHLHWRLNEPATGEDLARLKLARQIAAEVVGGDTTNVTIVHPIRWPGSWHRKGEPKLSRIVSITENETDLRDALERLEQVRPERAKADTGTAGEGQHGDRQDPRSTPELIANITSGREFHPSIVPLAARWIGAGMKPGAAVNQIRELMEAVPPENRDQRWHDRFAAVPANVTSAQAKFGEEPGEPIFDPWDDYIVPKFPLAVLPEAVQRFVTEQSRVVGCDPSALAMATLANASGSLDHRFKLKLMRNGDWWVSPRLWVLLVGDPSRKKTPVINTAVAELEAHQNRVRDEYEARLAEYEAALEGWDKKSGTRQPDEPRKPPRYVVSDTSTEKLGELLARTDRGILVKRDEFAGWLGSMEKYAGKGSGADRAFWLQSFDGGPFTVDRIARGEIRVSNLSTCLIGGIQPQKLAELHGLTSDGLLQRFLPVMMGPSAFPIDAPSSRSAEEYRRLTRQMIGAAHATLSLTDDALPVMEDLRRQMHELEQVAGGFAAGFQGFLGKLPGLAGSLALILHLMPDPQEQRLYQVSRQTAEDVRRLVMEFILPHAYEFYRTAESVTDGDRLRQLASWIVTAKKTRVTARDLTHNVRAFRGASLKDVHLRVSPLVAGGWLTPESPGPDNRVWAIAPVVAGQFEARCREEEARKAALARLMGSPRKGTP